MSTTEGKPQENAAEQAKRRYDAAMDVSAGVAKELAGLAGTDDAADNNDNIRAMAAVGQFSALTAQAAATRLTAAQVEAVNASLVAALNVLAQGVQATLPALAQAAAAFERFAEAYTALDPGPGSGIRAHDADCNTTHTAGPEPCPPPRDLAEPDAPVVIGPELAAHNERVRRRAERDAARPRAFLNAGDAEYGPWDEDGNEQYRGGDVL